MNKQIIQIGLLILIVLLLILEKGLFGTLPLFSLFIPSLIILVFLINQKSKNSYIGLFLIYGLLVDILNHSFIGITSLVYTIFLYLFYALTIRFPQNKIFIGLINLVFCLILSLGYFGFENYGFLEVYIAAGVTFIVSVFSWVRK